MEVCSVKVVTARIPSRMKLFLIDQAGENERTLSEEIRHRIERDIEENHDWGSFAVDTLNCSSGEDDEDDEPLFPGAEQS